SSAIASVVDRFRLHRPLLHRRAAHDLTRQHDRHRRGAAGAVDAVGVRVRSWSFDRAGERGSATRLLGSARLAATAPATAAPPRRPLGTRSGLAGLRLSGGGGRSLLLAAGGDLRPATAPATAAPPPPLRRLCTGLALSSLLALGTATAATPR